MATGRNQSFRITWSTDFVVPPLDTDEEQMTDAVEIGANRQPFDAADLEASFNTAGGLEGWSSFVDITGPQVSGGLMRGASSGGGDAQVTNTSFRFGASQVPRVQVRMRASQNTAVQRFFATTTQPGFSDSRVTTAAYTGNGDYQTVALDLTGQADWTGTVTALRLDPVSGAGISFELDGIRGPGL